MMIEYNSYMWFCDVQYHIMKYLDTYLYINDNRYIL